MNGPIAYGRWFVGGTRLLGSALLLGSVLSGCSRAYNPSLDAPGHLAAQRAREIAWNTHWDVSCDETHHTSCGLLTKGALGVNGARAFVREQCNPEADPDARQCIERFRMYFISQMTERYSRGIASVSNICENVPVDCSNPVVFELLALAAHNYSLEHFPNAAPDVMTGPEAVAAKRRDHQVAGQVSLLMNERMSMCERGELDCSCPEGGLGDGKCSLEDDSEDADEIESVPQGESKVQWL
ncbi:MAG TPA: hypothetical protein VHM70_07175 [Polyangiaceae bacterium]|jgi:hypothetical protein|nr:hypothetical protein [Polyangiaceae bacterium]